MENAKRLLAAAPSGAVRWFVALPILALCWQLAKSATPEGFWVGATMAAFVVIVIVVDRDEQRAAELAEGERVALMASSADGDARWLAEQRWPVDPAERRCG